MFFIYDNIAPASMITYPNNNLPEREREKELVLDSNLYRRTDRNGIWKHGWTREEAVPLVEYPEDPFNLSWKDTIITLEA